MASLTYWMRKKLAERNKAIRLEQRRADRAFIVADTIRAYEIAYTEMYGEPCRMGYNNGYAYYIKPVHLPQGKYRVKELSRMRELMYAAMHESELMQGIPESDL